MPSHTRRETLLQMSAITALISTLTQPSAAATRIGSAAREFPNWIAKTDELTALLRMQTLSVPEWRQGLGTLFAKASLEDILQDTDFTALSDKIGFADKGVTTANIKFGDSTRRLSFYPKIFAIGKGRAIIPHGHAGMVSAHLTLSGAMHLRQYDQLGRTDEALHIRPSIDREVKPGDLATIGTTTDNVHWFIAREPSHTFDMIVTGLEPEAEKNFDIFNIDIKDAIRESNGDLIAPRMDVETALAKYG